MRTVLRYIRPFIPRMSVGLFIKFFGTVMDLLLPGILAYVIDTVAPTRNVRDIWLWGGIMLLCSIVGVVTNIAANRMAARVARDTTEHLRHDLFDKALSLSSRQIDEVGIPSLETRLTTDTYQVHQMIGMMQRLGVRAPILLIGGVIVTLTLDATLAMTLISVLPFIALVVFLVSRRGIPMYTALQAQVDGMIRVVRENISGIRVIKALSKTPYEKKRFEVSNEQVMQQERKAATTMALTNPLMNILLNLGLTLVVLVGAWQVNRGRSQPGTIIAFLSYFTIILNAMMSITRMFVMYSKGTASAGRIERILHLPQDLREENLPRVREDAHIVFDNVSFSYNGKYDDVQDISFSLARGETLGIIGATGSGKSTLISLLMRLYDTDRGEVRIDGRPVRSIPDAELHRMFGVVFQNDTLFSDAIAQNIDFGRNLGEDALENAARWAQAAEFIHALPDGFSHMLSTRGTNLSGGQKQRVLIARALASKPDVLILDDASSALDYKTDAALRGAIRDHFAGTTTLIVGQRVSSIMHAQHILVMAGGRMAGYGTHAQLMAENALYQEIYASQMGEGDAS
ncbi:ABC transporter ATP-binding protein/permease [Eubacteriales bacterium OttesenSCG-928-A19]|nr:ABC transporter ATP-binding protein/permease [Eubacteriales bacterium OttesenSCG-928-A19]